MTQVEAVGEVGADVVRVVVMVDRRAQIPFTQRPQGEADGWRVRALPPFGAQFIGHKALAIEGSRACCVAN